MNNMWPGRRGGMPFFRHRPSGAGPQPSCLKDVIAAADAMARDRLPSVAVCECPHCYQWLILPERPVTVAFPEEVPAS